MTAPPEPTRTTTDAELIAAAATDPEAFGAIFDRHAPAIHHYLARRVGGSLADDLAAETFLIAFRGRNRYDPDQAEARPWLYGIAPNLLRGHQRAEMETEERDTRVYSRGKVVTESAQLRVAVVDKVGQLP